MTPSQSGEPGLNQSTFNDVKQFQDNVISTSTIVVTSPPILSIKRFFNKKEFSDVTCKLMNGNEEVEVLYLNKLVICSQSDFFKAMFSEHISMMEACSHEFIVDAQEDDIALFKIMMQSIYDMEILNHWKLDLLMDIYLLYDKYGFIGQKTYLMERIIGVTEYLSNKVEMATTIFSKFSIAIQLLSWKTVQKVISMTRAFWLIGDNNLECLEMYVFYCTIFDFNAALIHEWIFYSIKCKGFQLQKLKDILQKINRKFNSSRNEMKTIQLSWASSDPIYQYILNTICEVIN